MSRRQQSEAAERISAPILADLGLELIEVAVTGPGREPLLHFAVDHHGGGVTVDELQAASAAIETALEVAAVFPGRYRLEVSSPGIDRPWKHLQDFQRHIGGRVVIKTYAPLPDGARQIRGSLSGVEGETIRVLTESGESIAVEFSNIASARPQVDWAALLRGQTSAPTGAQGGPR